MSIFFFINKDDALENFSNGFNNFLTRKNLKPSEIAKELELKKSSVSMWKTGRGFPEFLKLCKLFEMGMTLKEMFGEKLANTINDNEKNAGENAYSWMDDNNKMFENLNKEISEEVKKHEMMKKLFESPEFKRGVADTLAEIEKQKAQKKEKDNENK